MLAERLATLDPFALANVVWLNALLSAMVTNRHPLTANPADRHTLQQGWTFPWRTLAALSSVRSGVLVQALLVLFELVPRNVARMRIGDKRSPFLPEQLLADYMAPALALSRPAKEKRSCKPRIVQEPQGAVVQERPPHGVTFLAIIGVPRKEQTLAAKLLHCCGSRPRSTKGPEEGLDALLDLSIWIQHYMVFGVVNESDRQWTLQLTPPRFVQDTTQQASPKHMEFGFTHRALHPQQQAVIEVRRIVDAILIQYERVAQSTHLEQPMPIG
jgi:hypothetical protein